MPQKWILAALVLLALPARADDGSADAALYGDFRLPLSAREELALWGSAVGESLVELGCGWKRERIELALVIANVFEDEGAPGTARNLSVRVKYFF